MILTVDDVDENDKRQIYNNDNWSKIVHNSILNFLQPYSDHRIETNFSMCGCSNKIEFRYTQASS